MSLITAPHHDPYLSPVVDCSAAEGDGLNTLRIIFLTYTRSYQLKLKIRSYDISTNTLSS